MAQASREAYSDHGNFVGQGDTRIIRSIRPVSRITLSLFAAVAGSVTLAWVTFLAWLAFGALRLALGLA
jgi:hypothetical protein